MTLDRMPKNIEEAASARCLCGHEFDAEELVAKELVTYHGDEEPTKFVCPQCQRNLTIEETVQRTYEVKEKEEQTKP